VAKEILRGGGGNKGQAELQNFSNNAKLLTSVMEQIALKM
jgi:hypothetical protein